MEKGKIVVVSGDFDCVHIGHIELFKNASLYGKIVCILNSDEWLIKKKGKYFMKWVDRAEILRSIKYISEVINNVDDEVGSVCEGLRYIRSHYPDRMICFANGGDRTDQNTPEKEVCKELNIEMLYNIGGGKIESSSWLLERASKK